MQLKHWGAPLLLGVTLFAGVLACRVTDTLIAQAQPTPTRTATRRPTFTPIPPPSPTLPPPPTVAPSPTTRPPTARPAATKPPPTKPPPTKPPVAPPPPPPSGPTVSPYEWHVNPPICTHSGITYLKGAVYSDKNDPGSRTPGMRVALGGSDGVTIYDRFTTEENGEYTFILSDPGQPGRKGTWYLWLVDSGGRRISDIGGPINTNGLGPDAPGTCWAGSVDFWK